MGMGHMWENMEGRGMARAMERRRDNTNSKERRRRESKRLQRDNTNAVVI